MRQTFSMIRLSTSKDLMLFFYLFFSLVVFTRAFILSLSDNTAVVVLVMNLGSLVNARAHLSLILSVLSLLHVTNALSLACSYYHTKKHQAARKTQSFPKLCDRTTLSNRIIYEVHTTQSTFFYQLYHSHICHKDDCDKKSLQANTAVHFARALYILS